MTEPLEVAFVVACPPEHAFDTWARRTALWWPSSHTLTSEPGTELRFEAREGGRIFECAPDGREHDWGRIEVWEPPQRLVYSWHLMFPAEDATEVDVTFNPADGGTAVRIVHRGWERLGEVGAERRERNRQGWAGVVEHYRVACESA